MPHSVELPFPPSVNNLFSQGLVKGKVRRFPSRKYKQWRKEANILLRLAKLPEFGMNRVDIRIALTPKDSRPRDVDNFNKAVLDALVEARVIADDRYIARVDAYWDRSRVDVGAVVTIAPAGEMPELKPDMREPLDAKDRTALRALIKNGGYRLLSTKERIPLPYQRLIDKGYVTTMPGIHDGAPPQGYKVA